jgi:hypothetical protein
MPLYTAISGGGWGYAETISLTTIAHIWTTAESRGGLWKGVRRVYPEALRLKTMTETVVGVGII